MLLEHSRGHDGPDWIDLSLDLSGWSASNGDLFLDMFSDYTPLNEFDPSQIFLGLWISDRFAEVINDMLDRCRRDRRPRFLVSRHQRMRSGFKATERLFALESCVSSGSGSVSESNRLGALFTPPTGFEDQGQHQLCKHSQD